MSQQGTAKGVVTDAQGPVIGAGVVQQGTQNGTVTDVDGSFSLANVPIGATIEISCIGYKTVTVVYDGQPINVVLTEDTEMLSEVVVTALGISRQKKSLGYAVQDVKSEELTKGGTATLTDALQGKVAGLMINNSGTGVGGSTKVVIRGNSSLSENNAPMWVVDGVPFDAAQDIDGSSHLWGGTDRAGGAFDINPEDIESVSVLKGPTAAALYGSRAGNGVILITTKKGGKKDGKLGIVYSGKFSVSPVAYTLDLQDTYGQGLDGVMSNTLDSSWGAVMNGQSIGSWWGGGNTTYSVQKNPVKNFYRSASLMSHNISISGGGAENPFRITIGRDDTKGQSTRETIEKTSLDVVSKFTVAKWLDFDFKANYVYTVGRNRPILGLYGSAFYLNTMPRNIQVSDLEQYWVDPNQEGQYAHMNWFGPDADHQNPYFVQNQSNNRDTKNRLFGLIAANIKFNDYLKLRIKQGLDYSGTEYKYWYPYNDPVFSTNYPAMEITRTSYQELNTEALLSYNRQINDDWTIGASIGGNAMHIAQDGLWGQGQKFPLLGAQYIALGTTIKSSNSVYRKQINSLYAFANVAYKDWLFVDLTAREDWSSTINQPYFYPSVSVSVLLTGLADAYGISYNKNVIDYGKIRFSWAQVGKDTDPYQLLDTYGTTTDAFDLLYAYIDDSQVKANANLKPEIATSFEVGTEWHFFQNRLGLDFTYYNTKTRNQVMALTMVQTTGSRYAYENVGQISNKGIELQLNGDIIRNKNFELGATLNLAHNVSMVDELAEGVSMYSLGSLNGGSSTLEVIAQEGEKLGQIYEYGYARDASGNIIVDDSGLPKKSDSKMVLGDIQPDLTGSFGLHANWKGLSASALLSFQKGGEIFSFTEYQAARYGTAKRTEDRADFIVAGVTESGAVNSTYVTAQEYWRNAIPEEFIYSASYLKLQEVSLGYAFPRNFLERTTKGIIDSARISLFGTNLLYFIKHTPGTTPDGSSADTSMLASAIDMTPLPNTRTFGVSLNVGF